MTLSKTQLGYFKERLHDIHTHLNEEIKRLEEATDQLNQDAEFGVSNHIADDASDIFEREKNFALIEDRQRLIGEVEAALDRIEHGTYGICLKTGKPIPVERLEVLPYAALSIEAANS
ncbi:TraR/DksA family transcriptional regulator [Herpetosiphon geysericola]|uniref:Zinc finger DksA/TraR C4-type domain-containing protein n=1 Tax=Herpetosiphon geysericola TaxID=70996 RepID=A0A0P6YFC7_9CHLR|nr:TraR/DksA C4-type zinc finger protein [Herpetosiphon geysericola]KPL88988.1 hypothetical protein SE18_10065 [Herpetosiphon geysericola]